MPKLNPSPEFTFSFFLREGEWRAPPGNMLTLGSDGWKLELLGFGYDTPCSHPATYSARLFLFLFSVVFVVDRPHLFGCQAPPFRSWIFPSPLVALKRPRSPESPIVCTRNEEVKGESIPTEQRAIVAEGSTRPFNRVLKFRAQNTSPEKTRNFFLFFYMGFWIPLFDSFLLDCVR
jgi:hypothetical protein